MPTVLKSGSLNLLEPSGPVQACNWIALPPSESESDSLRAGRSGDPIPVGAKFSSPVQPGPGAHRTSFTMGPISFTGLKRPERGVKHSLPSSGEVKGKVDLYLFSLCAFMAVYGLTSTFIMIRGYTAPNCRIIGR